ncbi:MAG: SET domain-containing protein-lysine N-methyltransferase [Planctomycetes bacterium]|nr:SET domain-containing protein-lysine N-methyltransferase [Planctomycetota bacterium]
MDRRPFEPGQPPLPPGGVEVRDTPGRGRGVFATRRFHQGEVIERAPVIVVPRSLIAPLKGSLLDDYWFQWGEHDGAYALGWASLYNHRCPSNATFTCDHAARTVVISTVRDIAPGEEILINYHGTPDDPDPLWFPIESA